MDKSYLTPIYVKKLIVNPYRDLLETLQRPYRDFIEIMSPWRQEGGKWMVNAKTTHGEHFPGHPFAW